MDVGAMLPPTHDLSDALDNAGRRRALVLDVAASQVVSLWSVADASPPALMCDYYAQLQHGTGRAEAAFIPAGDWRPLDTTAFLSPRSMP
jgi:hypothetical protein